MSRNAYHESFVQTLGRLVKSAQYVPEDHSRMNLVTEAAGGVTAPLLLALLTKDKDLTKDVTRGSLALASLGALLTRKRSRMDQAMEDAESHTLRNLLVPGVGSYSMFKRLGSTIN
jgi:hypothetical protein